MQTRKRLSTGLAAMLAVAAVLALGPAGTSAAPPGDNAILHWNNVASSAIGVGRAPASSSVLGGMVNGAMYDAVAATEAIDETTAKELLLRLRERHLRRRLHRPHLE
jgi:hypothetical protein